MQVVAYTTTAKGVDSSDNVTATAAAGDKWAMDVNVAGGTLSVTSSLYKGVLDLTPASSVSVPGTETTLITVTNGVGESRDIWQVLASCNQAGKLTVYVNSSLIATGRTGPGHPDVSRTFAPYYTTVAGDVIEVKFTGRAGTTASDVEVFLHTDLY